MELIGLLDLQGSNLHNLRGLLGPIWSWFGFGSICTQHGTAQHSTAQQIRAPLPPSVFAIGLVPLSQVVFGFAFGSTLFFLDACEFVFFICLGLPGTLDLSRLLTLPLGFLTLFFAALDFGRSIFFSIFLYLFGFISELGSSLSFVGLLRLGPSPSFTSFSAPAGALAPHPRALYCSWR